MTVLVILGAIPALFAIIKYILIMWSRISGFKFGGLAIRPVSLQKTGDSKKVTLKVAYVGDKKLIIQELSLKNKLVYRSVKERLLAWVKLAHGYFTDDVVGLQTVFDHVFPSSTWIIGGPVYRIKNKYLRKPLSILLGAVTVYFFIFYLIPVFWPMLWSGPYREIQQIARDENLNLHRNGVKLTRPFILDPGTEDQLDLAYSISSMILVMRNGVPLPEAKIRYTNESPTIKSYKLPRPNEFIWKLEVSLHVRVNEVWGVYPIESETGMLFTGN
jgi:hypothetical protein